MANVDVVQIPEGETPPSVVWCPTCGANFNPPHDCRQHLGALINMKREIDAQVQRIETILDEQADEADTYDLTEEGKAALDE